MNKLPIVEVSIFINLGPLCGMILGFLILKETMQGAEILAGILGLSGCTLIVLGAYQA